MGGLCSKGWLPIIANQVRHKSDGTEMPALPLEYVLIPYAVPVIVHSSSPPPTSPPPHYARERLV